MPRALDEGPARLTSTLADARNDTGRMAYCGPIVLSAITGYSVSKVEDEIRAHMRRLRQDHGYEFVLLLEGGPDVTVTAQVAQRIFRA